MRRCVLACVWLCVVLLAGCGPGDPDKRTGIGALVAIEPVPTSWNEAARSRVITKKATMTVYGFASGWIGGECHIQGGRVWLPQPDGSVLGWQIADR